MNDEPFVRLALYSYWAAGTVLAGALLLGWLAVVQASRSGSIMHDRSSPYPAVAGTARALRSNSGISRGGALRRWSTGGVWLAFAVLSVSLFARAVATGLPPWASQYEFAVAFAWGTLGAFAVLTRTGRPAGLELVVPALALGALLYASTLPSAPLPTVPALQNRPLLALHVGGAIIAYGANAVAFGAALLFLLQGRAHAITGRHLAILPTPRALDELGYRAVMVGFPMLAATLLLGSWWGSIAWGYYWNWDPKETATLATWLVYGIYLHVRASREWGGTGSALLLVLGFALTVFTYFGNLFFSSLHSYSGV